MATETPAASTAEKPKKPQSAVQVPNYADEIAGNLAVGLDDSKKHVVGAAILAFKELPADTQVAFMTKARVAYRESANV